MSMPIQTTQIILIPEVASKVAPGAQFLDKDNGNALSIKSLGGIVTVLAGGQQDPTKKQMQSAGIFSYGSPIGKMADGRVILCSSDQVNRKNFIGYALQASTYVGQPVNVFLVGPNIAGILTGLNFAPGDHIMIGENGEYVNNTNSFTGSNDDYITVGIADCPGGPVASVAATDLISLPDRIMNIV